MVSLVVGIKPDRLEISGDVDAPVANLKAGGRKSTGIAEGRRGFLAWRMDDKRRISVLLAEAAVLEKLCGLTERCFELVSRKK